MFQRILVALDRTLSSREVLEKAIAMATPGKTQLHLVSVMPPLDTGYTDPMYFSMEGMHGVWTTEMYQSRLVTWRQNQQELDHWLRSHTDYAQRQGIHTDHSCPVGIPGNALCELAGSWDADLIMMGRRGRTGFSELLLGSVSNYVMHHAPCSVLTVQGIKQPAMATATATAATVTP